MDGSCARTAPVQEGQRADQYEDRRTTNETSARGVREERPLACGAVMIDRAISIALE